MGRRPPKRQPGGITTPCRPAAAAAPTATRTEARGNRGQVGEQAGPPVVSAVLVNGQILTSIDPEFSRPYTDEYTFSVDRELMANFKLSTNVTYRRERELQASMNPDNPYDSVLTNAVDPGPDGFVGTGDDATYGFYARTSAL